MDDLWHKNAEKISAVYAATDATFIEMDFPVGMETMPAAIMKFGKTFHRLTPEYWAWFYHKFTLMENALTRKKISEAMFVEILDRISALYNQALAHYGRDALKQAEASLDFNSWDEKIRKEKADAPPQVKHKSGVPRLVVGR